MRRRPAFLSGGQRQRVAMGRAMVREPKAFLMDEPLSNLDAKLRVAMRGELTRLHDRLGVTTVYVTHDQVEAMTLGQRVAVMLDGVLQQCDTPQKLFHQPANLFVAAFMGSPSMNVVEAEVADGRSGFAGLSVPLAAGITARRRQPHRHPRRPPHRPAASRRRRPPACPRITVRPDVIEELGGLSNLLFPLDAPRVHDRRHAGRDRGHRRRRRDAARGRPPRPVLRVDRRAAPGRARRRDRARRRSPVPPLLRPRERGRDHERGASCEPPEPSSQPPKAPASGGGTRSSARPGAHQLRLAHRAADPGRRVDGEASRTAPPSGAVRPARRRGGRPRCRRP